MIARWNKDQRVTVCNSAGFLCVNEPRHVAYKKLLAAGYEPADAASILDTRVGKSVWHSTWAAASSATNLRMEEAIEGVATTADVAAIRQAQTTLETSVTELKSALAADRLQQEIRELEANLDSQAQQCRDALAARGQKLTRFAENFIWETLWATPTGRRLASLRESA